MSFTDRLGITRALSLFLFLISAASAQSWLPLGPYGGDARSFAATPGNPRHLYLGTTSGWVYSSLDGGANWQRLAHLGQSDDLVVDHILVDPENPQTIYAAAWVLARGAGDGDGGIFISLDSGHHFAEVSAMHGQSVMALAQAPSNANLLFAGTLKGVYRSSDRGQHWELISPAGSQEIHEIESLAIDPRNPEVIYAGTWHLPWKTTDGGKSWHNIKQGIIDDSDVFSILVDPEHPNVVYASACSGIYKSVNSGGQFVKIQGIPSTARRTRVLMQDPVHLSTVYAGTTEGLYRTTDAGHNWQRMTTPETIVNDVFVDPSNPEHVMLATDRAGVLNSINGAHSFLPSNQGVSQREVHALAVDPSNPQRMVAGVVNDKFYGGAFFTTDGGRSWQQKSIGLDGRDVLKLMIAKDGSILAGTDRGILRLKGDAWGRGGMWELSSSATLYPRHPLSSRKSAKGVPAKPAPKATGDAFADGTASLSQSRIFDMQMEGELLCVAASSGVFCSRDNGQSWQGGTVLYSGDIRRVAIGNGAVYAVRPGILAETKDEGKSWQMMSMPTHARTIRSIAVTPTGDLWLAAAEGLYLTHNHGDQWLEVGKFPMRDMNAITYEPSLKQLIVTSDASPLVYKVNEGGLGWSFVNAGWLVHEVKLVNGRFIAASLYDGVVAEPERTLAQQ